MISARSLTRPTRRVAGAGALCATLALASCGGDDNANAYKVRAIFESAAFVQKGLDVRVAGVTVGAVDDVELTEDNEAAVTFSITDAGFQDFRKDSRCTIRPQALIGERYIECELTAPRPQGATAPPALSTIADGEYKGQHLMPVDRTAVPVDSDQVLNVNDASTRDRFGIIIRELGAGVAGRGDEIEQALDKGNEGLVQTNRLLEQLSDQTEMLKNLTSTSDQTLSVLAAERDSIGGTIENGATVASTLASNKNNVKGTIAALSDAIKEVEPSVSRVTELTDELQPIADDLNRSADDLGTVFDLLPEVSRRGTTAVESLSPTLKRGTEVLTSDSTDALFKRLDRTATGIQSTISVLGLTLGDFRTTGGLDYFLDAIYGLTYSTNGRDGTGSYLRGRVINAINCIQAPNAGQATCGTRLGSESGGLETTRGSGSEPAPAATSPDPGSAARASKSPAKAVAPKTDAATATPTPTVEQAATSLLLGGTQ